MDKYRVGSFNLYKYSTNTAKAHETIARIIDENRIDILGVQEIFSKEALDKIVRALNNTGHSHWDGRWESPNSRSASAAEGYAFIWNTDRIELSRNRSGKVFEPVIHNQYPHKDTGDLIRNPFYGRFVIRANKMFEFRVINTHIMFSQNRSVNEDDNHDSSVTHLSDVALRKREFDILASKILPKLDDKTYDYQWNEVDGICRRPYTILLGDYNLNLKESGAQDTFLDENQQLIIIQDANSEKRIVTVQKDLSTLRAKTQNKPIIDGYRNNFDHFTYDENRPMQIDSWAVDIPNNPEFYSGDYDKYKAEVSDHLMVVMEIQFV